MSQMQLLRQRRYLPLFLTQFFGAFNDNFLKNAMVIMITFQATSVLGVPVEQMVSVAGGIFILPFFLFSATSGQLADKYDKSTLIRMIKTIEIGIMTLATVGFLTHQFVLLLGVLFLMGLHSTFFGPLKYSILPQLLRNSELVGGNALIEAGTFLAILLGTIGGGLLIALPHHGPEIVSAVLMLVAGLGWMASRPIPKAAASDPDLAVQWNPVTPTWDILKATRKDRTIFITILAISWFWLFGAAILSLFPVYCKDVLQTNETVVTLFLACFSIGIGIGSVLCERLSHGEEIETGLVPLGAVGMTVFLTDFSYSGRPAAFVPALSQPATVHEILHRAQGLHVVMDLILLSIFSGIFIVPLNALLQQRSDAAHRSRVIAANNIINSFFMVLASVFTVLLLKLHLEVTQIFLILAGFHALAAIWLLIAMPEFMARSRNWLKSWRS